MFLIAKVAIFLSSFFSLTCERTFFLTPFQDIESALQPLLILNKPKHWMYFSILGKVFTSACSTWAWMCVRLFTCFLYVHLFFVCSPVFRWWMDKWENQINRFSFRTNINVTRKEAWKGNLFPVSSLKAEVTACRIRGTQPILPLQFCFWSCSPQNDWKHSILVTHLNVQRLDCKYYLSISFFPFFFFFPSFFPPPALSSLLKHIYFLHKLLVLSSWHICDRKLFYQKNSYQLQYQSFGG